MVCASGRLMHEVPSSFQIKPTASNLNHSTPCSRYRRIIFKNSNNTSGLLKFRSTWSWLKVHQTKISPELVLVGLSRSDVRGLMTWLVSVSAAAVMKKFLPGSFPVLKFSNQRLRVEQWLRTRSTMSLKLVFICVSCSQLP